MILESKGTPDIIENILKLHKEVLINCVKNQSSIKLDIDETITKNDTNRNLKCHVEINFIIGINYKGDINFKECLNSMFRNCIINVYLPKNYDLSFVFKTLSHELTHLYELYQISDKFDITKWKWREALNDMNGQFTGLLLYFRDILYLSLPQELNARVSSIYFYLNMRAIGGDYMEKITKILHGSTEWQNYTNLINFEPNTLTKDIIQQYGQNIENVFFIVNELNSKIGIDKKIKNIEDLNSYFKILDKIFKKSAEKYKSKLLRVVDKVFDNKNKQFECFTSDPEDVNYEKYVEMGKKDNRDYILQNIIEYSEFIKKISKNDN